MELAREISPKAQELFLLLRLFRKSLGCENSIDVLQAQKSFLRHIGRFEDADLAGRIIAIQSVAPLELLSSLSDGQLHSKFWLAEELGKILSSRKGTRCFIVGGWTGLLSYILLRLYPELYGKVRSFDLDPNCEWAADELNRRSVIESWRFKAITANALNLDYKQPSFMALNETSWELLEEGIDLLVNTSCEHFPDFSDWWDRVPPGMLVALQSNDFRQAEGHVNCVDSLEDFMEKAPLSEVLGQGTLNLGAYRRFLLVGVK